MFNLIMTTQNIDGEKTKRFFDSLNAMTGDIREKLFLYIINQDKRPAAGLTIKYKEIFTDKCSLSKARNLGLAQLPEEPGIIAFPDDDCWYSDSILKFVEENINNNDFICTGVFDPYKGISYGNNRPLKTRTAIDEANALLLPISVGIFYKYSAVDEIPFFDERFGVGTDWGSGEETDFVLQLLKDGKRGEYNSFDCVYHEAERDKDFNVSSIYKDALGFAAMAEKSKYVRKQDEAYKQFKKIKARSYMAKIYYLFVPNKRAVYSARLKGFKRGCAEGREFYRNENAR